MSNANQQHSDNGVTIWLANQFGAIQRAIGELHSNTMGNRQTLFEVYHQLTHRMDRIEDRLGQRPRFAWVKHVPYVKLTLLLIATLLVITGHLTVAEIKAYIIKRLMD